MARQLLRLLRAGARRRVHASGIRYSTITGTLDGDERAARELADWVAAAAAVRDLRRRAHRFPRPQTSGMLDMYSDFTQVHGQLGSHVEVLEIDTWWAVEAAQPAEVGSKVAEIRAMFRFADPRATRSPHRSTTRRSRVRRSPSAGQAGRRLRPPGLTTLPRLNATERSASGRLIVGNSL